MLTAMIVCAAILAATMPQHAAAATKSEHPLLQLDRSDRALTDAEWDELEGALRQASSTSSPAAFEQSFGATLLVDPAPDSNDLCGESVALGDVNADGRADALVGCYGDDSFRGNALVFTKNAGAGFTHYATLTDPAPAVDDYCGMSVALGDVNNDGQADAIVGCHRNSSNRGNALVFTKNAGAGFTHHATLTDPTPTIDEYCGVSVALGDVNADHRADAIIGCSADDTGAVDSGNALVYTKNVGAGFTFHAALTDPSAATDDICGISVALGDVTADGRADALVGCYGDDGDIGNALVFTKNVGAGFTHHATLTDPAPAAGDLCGGAVALGDINADGKADALIGCHGDAALTGNALVFTKNSGSGFAYHTTLTDPSPAANDRCGMSVALGDATGDGRADALIGCYLDDTAAANAGNVLVFAKNAGAGFTHIASLVDPAPTASDYCGTSVALGDMNSDGRADALTGCYGENPLFTGTAIAFLLEGGSILADPAPAVNNYCGTSTAIGDVNSDGRSDAIVGCIGDDGNRGNALVFTKNVGVGFTHHATLTDPAPAANDYCGSSVAVGDVDGDGRADALVGCRGDNGSRGNALVFTKNVAAGFTHHATLTDPVAAANDYCGTSLALGDVNADARGDVLIGCNGDNANSGNGVVFTKDAGPGFTYHATLTDPGVAAGDFCGESVAMGDVDGDGYADALVGCRGDNGSRGNALVFTKNAGVGFTYHTTLTDPAPVVTDNCGVSVGLGDVNGDGRADAIVGCPGDSGGRGNALVFTKDAGSGFTHNATLTDPTIADPGNCGLAVALGDMNADGRSDALVGCDDEDITASSSGSALAFPSTSAVRFRGTSAMDPDVLVDPSPASDDNCGASVALGDIDNDGRLDALIGCIGNNSWAGNALVFTKNPGAGFTYYATLTDSAPAANDQCGISVSLADVNADGRFDALVGCRGNNTNSGNAIVFTKNVGAGFTQHAILTHPTPAANDNCGFSVALGDVNVDGRADALIGCYLDNGTRGTALVFTKNAGAGFTHHATLIDPVPAVGDGCGTSVALGDVNADGRADALIGCYLDDTEAPDSGNALVFTKNGTAGFTHHASLTDPDPLTDDDHCGYSVALGDVNADGLADAIIGCPYHDGRRGDTLVFTKSPAGFTHHASLTDPDAAADDRCGYSVALGDVNGDGRDDAFLGCYLDNSGGADAGNALVFTKNAGAGFTQFATLHDPDPTPGDYCGSSVAFGDVNADGRAEALVGCTYDDTAASDGGKVVVESDWTGTRNLRSLRLNALEGTITEATVNLGLIGNGSDITSLEASADGGVNWEPITAGAAHSFAVPGTDMRLRMTMTDNPWSNLMSTPFLFDLQIDYTYTPANSPPDAPPLVSPANGASTTDPTPDLEAQFDDPDGGDTGTLQFEVCTVAMGAGQTCVAAGGSIVTSGSSAGGIANGANGTWTVAPVLGAETTYHWHARATDNNAATGAWSASRSLTIDPYLNLLIDDTDHPMGSLIPGDSAFATSIVTIQTNDPDGYNLYADDQNATWAASCVCGGTIPDWSGTNADPMPWALATHGYGGLTVRDTTGVSTNRLAKWGAPNVNGWPENDVANNEYVGLSTGNSILLHNTAGTSPNDTVTITYRLTPSAGTTAGAYTGEITVTALANP